MTNQMSPLVKQVYIKMISGSIPSTLHTIHISLYEEVYNFTDKYKVKYVYKDPKKNKNLE